MSTISHLFKRATFSLPSTYASPPPGYLTPQWPGLYGPNSDPIYLYVPSTIWKFTLYWTLLLEGIVFMGCGLYASYTFWRSGRKSRDNTSYDRQNEKKREGSGTIGIMVRGESRAKETMLNNNKRKKTSVGTIIHQEEEWIPLNRHRRASSIITTIHHPSKQNLYKSIRRPFASIFLIPTFFFVIFSFSAIISGSLVGWAIAALYNAAFLRMSTWVPALWSAGLTLIVIISSYSNISTVL
ncbi:hypothetical protein H4Q26_008402 [Puccinia striiformis f. sp. tritici PST-130]|nr:hypothetical protein H4Q26_008402 [Puccinia striiformis f. sp. tritici PST-130]